MDIYIAEEYVTCRRKEKKAAADARRMSETAKNSGRMTGDVNEMRNKSSSCNRSGLDESFMVSSGGVLSSEHIEREEYAYFILKSKEVRPSESV
ncbi:hypothetical protein Scep_006625 [Stephania cephalantha]|uniref:Uncharacterized protein n=1 Tax=Stephania cephalantha TaxID=152367 RepID=A0AAP0K888_9MAGN